MNRAPAGRSVFVATRFRGFPNFQTYSPTPEAATHKASTTTLTCTARFCTTHQSNSKWLVLVTIGTDLRGEEGPEDRPNQAKHRLTQRSDGIQERFLACFRRFSLIQR